MEQPNATYVHIVCHYVPRSKTDIFNVELNGNNNYTIYISCRNRKSETILNAIMPILQIFRQNYNFGDDQILRITSALTFLPQLINHYKDNRQFKTTVLVDQNKTMQTWEMPNDDGMPTYYVNDLLGSNINTNISLCVVCDNPTKLGCEVCLKPACSTKHHVCGCLK